MLGYRSEYLDVINEGGSGIDRFVDDHTQLDLSARFAFTDQVRGFVELNNVTNEPFRAFFNTPNGKALSQYEEYGYSYSFGLKYKY